MAMKTDDKVSMHIDYWSKINENGLERDGKQQGIDCYKYK